MDNEYIIINKTTILEKIDKLKILAPSDLGFTTHEIIFELNSLLEESLPLIPEIEKSWQHGYTRGYNLAYCNINNSECLTPDMDEYISYLS